MGGDDTAVRLLTVGSASALELSSTVGNMQATKDR
jgi:hypothetical protein